MNIKEVDKWLDEEYGCSYTRLSELHDFVIDQDLKHQEQKDKEIERLNNIIDEIEKELNIAYKELMPNELVNGRNLIKNIQIVLKELKEGKE